MTGRFCNRLAPFFIPVLILLAGCRGAESRLANRSDWKPPEADTGDHGGAPNSSSRPSDVTALAGKSGGLGANGPVGAPPPGGLSAGRPRDTNAKFDPVAEHLAQGRDELNRGNLDQAKLHFNRVLQDVPNHTEAHHRLAVVADKQQNWPEAEKHYRAALRARPNDPNLHSDFGYSYLLQGRYADSEKELQAALKVDGGHPRALNNLGLLYGRQGNYAGALATFRRAGSDEEAQQKMARMFPDAGPADVVAAAGLNGAGGPAANVDSAGYQSEPVYPKKMPSDPAAANQILAGIKARMEEERRRGEAAREQAQANRRLPAPQRFPATSGAGAMANAGVGDAQPFRRQNDPGMLDRVNGPVPQGMGHEGALPDGYASHSPDQEIELGPPQVIPASNARAGYDVRSQAGPAMTPPQRSIAARPVQIPESYMGRDRREIEPTTAGPSSGVVNAAGDDVWPPRSSRGGAGSSIERTGYSQDRRFAGQASNNPSPLAPTAAEMEAQRMATQIGMGAGPGGMFSYVDRDSDPQGRREDGANRNLRMPSDGYTNDPAGRENARMNAGGPAGQNYGGNEFNGRSQHGLADPRGLNGGFGHGAMNGGPGGAMNGRGDGMANRNDWGMPPVRREWREDEQSIDGDPTMPPRGASALTQSHQDHMDATGMSRNNVFYDPEHAAILNEIRREKRMAGTSQMRNADGDAPELQSQQYYNSMDPSMQAYESMRSEARAAARGEGAMGSNPRGGEAPAGYSAEGGYGPPSGIGPQDGYGGNGAMNRATNSMPLPASRNFSGAAAGVSPWGSNRGMDVYGQSPRRN